MESHVPQLFIIFELLRRLFTESFLFVFNNGICPPHMRGFRIMVHLTNSDPKARHNVSDQKNEQHKLYEFNFLAYLLLGVS